MVRDGSIPRSLKRFLQHWPYLLIFLVIFFTFQPTLHFSFVNWDDDFFLLNNPLVRTLSWESVRAIFQHTVQENYVPLTILSFAVEHHFWGFDPFVYHLTNILLHIVNAWLVFTFARRLGLARAGAVIAALLFGVHPLRIESVAWVTERKDVLSAFFYLSAVQAYCHYLRRREPVWNILVVVLGTLAMLAKPTSVTLPLVLLLCDWFLGRKLDGKVIVDKLLLVLALSVIAQMTFLKITVVPVQNPLESAAAFQQAIFMRVWAFVFYLRQFFIPGPWLIFHRIPRPVAWDHQPYAWSLVIFLCLLGLLLRVRKNRGVILGFLFYTLTLSVMLVLVELDYLQSVALRFLYLPSVGLCLLAGYLWDGLWIHAGKWMLRAVSLSLTVILLSSFSFQVKRESRVWENGMALWDYQLKHNPAERTFLLYYKLAEAHLADPLFRETMRCYRDCRKQAFTDHRDGEDPCEAPRSAINKVFSLLQISLRFNPRFPATYYALGDLYLGLGEDQQAMAAYRSTASFAKDPADADRRLGQLFLHMGNTGQARRHFLASISAQPDNPAVYYQAIWGIRQAFDSLPVEKRSPGVLKEILGLYHARFHRDPPGYITGK